MTEMKQHKIAEFFKHEKNRTTWARVAMVFVAAVILEATSIVQLRLLNKTTRREAMIKAENVLSTTQ